MATYRGDVRDDEKPCGDGPDDALDVLLIGEPTESFDVWLAELLSAPPIDFDVSGAELVAEARRDAR